MKKKGGIVLIFLKKIIFKSDKVSDKEVHGHGLKENKIMDFR